MSYAQDSVIARRHYARMAGDVGWADRWVDYIDSMYSIIVSGSGVSAVSQITPAGGTLTINGLLVADAGQLTNFATSTTRPFVRMRTEEGIALFTIEADADTFYEMAGDPASNGSFTENISCASGKYEKNLTDNLASAYAVKINGGNSFYTLVSTDNAETFRIDNTFSSVPPADQSLSADAQTITLPTGINKVCTTTGARTGIILAPGTVDGQIINIMNASANSITFAAAGTSNVAEGTSAVIAANKMKGFVWDAGSSRWYMN